MNRKKVIVVMPAYNAAQTIVDTYRDLPKDSFEEIIVVDDASTDNTVEVARNLGVKVVAHSKNLGYGSNQKTCYSEALKHKADIIVMVHPDYQYDSSLILEVIGPIKKGRFDIMFGSRIRTREEALAGGMPYIKYVLNRMVSLIENIVLGVNFTEHFSGFRAYSKKVLKTLPFKNFSNDFVFDQQLMVSAIAYGFKIAEYPVPVRYFSKASSIRFAAGTKFLLETFFTLFTYILYKMKIYKSKIFA